ncbi:short chain dehydrogenase/reductase family oxidoreductase [Galdieria sulphuraria]|uniref:Short chain dehydrogenase/reductase family oxidoreductase n=1 Tax=Galdieria sulphuraria TaxID=130081 RepID=M2Y485_GALSU|nr:short chain dehydrogenase/reductase family oxidoreductase [Galdieria sulphuraria]EME30644.1 short chain dehydrogenase/reductase family oxidoreductase [Galdieria sulphuraria]|eukprot:XP_005707164.1 short chain dehydrogenase/reductase family oxidoreductase [Galdieria sulphuraria]
MAQWKYVLLGGSGGIGTQLCHLLKSESTYIVVGSRSEAKLKELSKAIPGIETFPLDACDSTQVGHCNTALEESVKYCAILTENRLKLSSSLLMRDQERW